MCLLIIGNWYWYVRASCSLVDFCHPVENVHKARVTWWTRHYIQLFIRSRLLNGGNAFKHPFKPHSDSAIRVNAMASHFCLCSLLVYEILQVFAQNSTYVNPLKCENVSKHPQLFSFVDVQKMRTATTITFQQFPSTLPSCQRIFSSVCKL